MIHNMVVKIFQTQSSEFDIVEVFSNFDTSIRIEYYCQFPGLIHSETHATCYHQFSPSERIPNLKKIINWHLLVQVRRIEAEAFESFFFSFFSGNDREKIQNFAFLIRSNLDSVLIYRLDAKPT